MRFGAVDESRIGHITSLQAVRRLFRRQTGAILPWLALPLMTQSSHSHVLSCNVGKLHRACQPTTADTGDQLIEWLSTGTSISATMR
jgi:hypothetical protein